MRLFRIIACLTGAAIAASAEETRPRTSRHLSEAILAGYRKDDGEPAPEREPTPVDNVEDHVELPPMKIQSGGGASKEMTLPPTVPPPLVIGTGVTEIRGKRYTVNMRRILFIPIVFRLEW